MARARRKTDLLCGGVGGCGRRRFGTIALTRLPRRASVGGDRRCGSSLRGPVGSQHHDHVAAVLLRTGLDETEIRDLFAEPAQEPETQLGATLLATPEHDRHLDLVTRLEEPHHVTLLGLVVVRVDLRPELHLLDDGLLLVAPRFAGLQCALVLELAEVHELAHRRPRHRSNLDQVQVDVRGQLKGALQGDDAHLFTLRTDQTDLTSPDLFVHAWFDADGASSERTVSAPARIRRANAANVGRPRCPRVPGAGKAEGPGICQGPLDRSSAPMRTHPEPRTAPRRTGPETG